MATIARDYLTDWESLRPYLGLNRQQEEEIRRSFPNNYGKQKQECLERWRELKGDEVTYGALITAAEKARNQHLADRVKDMLSRRLVQNHNPQSTTKQEKVNEVTDQGKVTALMSPHSECHTPVTPQTHTPYVHVAIVYIPHLNRPLSILILQIGNMWQLNIWLIMCGWWSMLSH